MHELAIAQSIIEKVETAARAHASSCVKKIVLRIGAFTGIVGEALEFSFDVAKKGTLAADAELEIEIVPLRKKCSSCGEVAGSKDEPNFLCPQCLRPVQILAGRELQIAYIELE